MGTRFAIENPFYLNGFNRYQYLKFREKKKKLTDEFGGYRSNDYDYLHSATRTAGRRFMPYQLFS